MIDFNAAGDQGGLRFDINPATGLPMSGGVDAGGNPYGVNNLPRPGSSATTADTDRLSLNDVLFTGMIVGPLVYALVKNFVL